MSQNLNSAVAVIGIDIGKNSFHVVGLDDRGAIVLRQKWSRGQIEARLTNLPPCLIGMEACVGAHHLSRKLGTLGHDARLMPAKYVRPYSKGQKNDFRDAEAIAEAVQRPTMKFVATKTAEQLRMKRSLYQRGLGYNYEATKIFMPAGSKQPVVVHYLEHVPADVTASIFWLKNRDPEHWRDVQNVEHALGKYIISHKPMTVEQ